MVSASRPRTWRSPDPRVPNRPAGRAGTSPDGALAAVLAVAGSALFAVSPRAGLAFAGTLTGLWLVTSPELGLALLVAVVPFDQLSGLLPGGALALTRLLGGTVAAVWLAALVLQRRRPLWDRRVTSLALLLGWAALILPWTVRPKISAAGIATLAQLFLLYWLTRDLLRRPEQLGRLLDTGLIAAVGLAIVVFWQLEVGRERATVSLDGIEFNANYLATALVVPLVIAVARSCGRGRPLWRLAAASPLAVAVVLTGSRGGLMAALAGIAVILVARPRLTPLILAGVLAAGSAAVVMAPAPVVENLTERLRSSFADRGSGRLDIWIVAGRMAAGNPVTGVGLAGFRPAFREYFLEAPVDPRWAADVRNRYGDRAAHNTPLLVLAELGVVGFALFLSAVVRHLRPAWRACKRPSVKGRHLEGDIPLAVLAGFSALLVGSLSIDALELKATWLLLGMVGAAAGQNAARSERKLQ